MWEQTQHIFLESLTRVLHGIARQLPGVLAMLLLLLLAVGAALLLRGVVRRVCERLCVDRRLREWGFAGPPGEGQIVPSLLIERLVTWTVLAVGFLAGLNAFETSSTSALASRLLDFVPNLVVAVVIVFVGLAGSRAVERSVLIGAVNMGLNSARLIGLGARWLVVILAFGIALEQLGVGARVVPVSLGILFGGIVLALALAVGLGAKDVVARSLDRRFPGAPKPLGEPEDEDEEGKLHHL
jgi:Mechanosensitive ion channel, conserved TM helix